MTFEDDNEALTLLEKHGIHEQGNGFLRGDWSELNEDCRDAVRYLCDEWDFEFKNNS